MIDNKSEIHTSLFELEKELNSLKSARQQISDVLRIGNNVVNAVSSLKEDAANHLLNLKADYEKKVLHFDESFSKTEQQLNSAMDKIEANNINYLKDIKKETTGFLKEQNETSTKSQNDLISTTKNVISDIANSLSESVSSTKEIYAKQNNDIKGHLDNYEAFLANVQKLLDTIHSVDFPKRLDKIDNTISGINIGSQNIQTKLSDLDRSLKNDIEKTNVKISNAIKLISSETDRSISFFKDRIHELSEENKNRNKYLIIAVVFGLLILVAIAIKTFV